MENVVKEVRIEDKVLKIYNDNWADSPRSWDNLAKMIFLGKHKSLGDKHDFDPQMNFSSRNAFIVNGEILVKKHFKDVAIIKAVHLYEHSGTSISTKFEYPYNCQWDSGTVGFVIVTKSDIKKDFNVKRITKKLLEQAERILDSEVETLNKYISGEVYRFEVLKVVNGKEEHEDSCGGFYGSDFATNGITDYISDERLVEALKAA